MRNGVGASGGRGRLAACFAALVIYGLACIGSGLDRMAPLSPALASFVPGPFRGKADLVASADALAQGHGQEALARAADAVRRAPVDGQALGRLGMARLLMGDRAGADAAFRVAALAGWRDLPTQIYWYRAALSVGEPAMAARRLDAMLRTRPAIWHKAEMFVPLEMDEGGRMALAQRLAERPAWAQAYLSPDARLPLATLRHRAEVMARAGGMEAGPACDTAWPLALALAIRGLRAEAERLWHARCGGAAFGVLADGDFRRFAATPQPARARGWRLHPSGDITVAIRHRGDGTAIVIRNDGPVSRIALSQPLSLGAGRYRAVMTGRDNDRDGGAGDGAGRGRTPAPSLDCGTGPSPRPADGPVMAVAGECPVQTFSLWMPAHGVAVLQSVRIEKID